MGLRCRLLLSCVVLASLAVPAAQASAHLPLGSPTAGPRSGSGSGSDGYDVWSTVSAAWGDNSTATAHTCGIQIDGSMWCWGLNRAGQLGLGDTDTRYRPVRVGGDSDWVQVSTDNGMTCAIKTGRTLWCWGGRYGHVPSRVDEARNWRSIALGDGYRCGTRTNDSLWCWGRNTIGQLGLGDSKGRKNPVRVAGSWASVDAGGATTCGIQVDHGLYCWGDNEEGQMGTGDSPVFGYSPTRVGEATDWTQVVDGWNYTCGIRASSTLWCWGNNDVGQLGLGDHGGGTYRYVPARVGRETDWSLVTAGVYHTCATRSSGELWCWGSNGSGELGIGQPPYFTEAPVRLGSLTTWDKPTAGGVDTCSTQTNHTLWCWGDPGDGELGVGSRTEDPTVPVQLGPSNTEVPVSYSLASVSARSPTDIWAVGQKQRKSIVSTFVEHGDGTAWSEVPGANPGPRRTSLAAVAALSPGDVWAVGDYKLLGANRTLAERWDGSSWKVIKSPNSERKNSELVAISALSETDIWAVGQADDYPYNYPSALVEHWDGTAWSVVPIERNIHWAMQTLTGVKAIGPNDVWATGYGLEDEEAGYLPLSYHWNGLDWRQVHVKHGDRFASYFQRAIDATSRHDVWAVGDQQLSFGHETTRVEHWTGGPWQTVDVPSPGVDRGSYLEGVSAVAASDVWAVGRFDNGTSMRALFLHWDGSAWSQVSGPSPGGRFDTTLTSVSADAGNDAWSVGFFDNGVKEKPVIMHWDGRSWIVALKGVG